MGVKCFPTSDTTFLGSKAPQHLGHTTGICSSALRVFKSPASSLPLPTACVCETSLSENTLSYEVPLLYVIPKRTPLSCGNGSVSKTLATYPPEPLVKFYMWASEMAEWLRVLAAKPGTLSSNLGTHMVERKNIRDTAYRYHLAST